MYEYKAKVIAIHDGDTLTLNIDVGFNTWLINDIRLLGIDAPELVTRVGKRVLIPEGEVATQGLLSLLGKSNFYAARTPPTFGIPGDYLAKAGKEPEVIVQTRINKDPDFDKYGRVLGTLYTFEVFTNKRSDSINNLMLKNGWAKAYNL